MTGLVSAWLVWALGCGQPVTPSLVFPDPAEGLLSDLDTDGSGAVTWGELEDSLVTEVQFSAMDGDGDGQLTVEELRTLLSTYQVRLPPGVGRFGKGPPGKGGKNGP
jgi:hypothetical protein